MKEWVKREARLWIGVLVAIAAHELLARGLAHAGLIERLLSPSATAGTVVALAAALVLYGLRFGLLFVVPGWLLARAIAARRGRQP